MSQIMKLVIYLGEKMYVLMNKMDYGQEMNEGKVSFKDFLKN